MWAADPAGAPGLGWPWRSRHPFGVDTFVAVQMAARPSIFSAEFAPLTQLAPVTRHAPLHGPVVVTFSRRDHANRLWHRLAEGVPGIGATGATAASTIALKRPTETYTTADFPGKVVNIDATRRYRRGSWTRPEGAHSDYLHPESAHLLLSLAALARQTSW